MKPNVVALLAGALFGAGLVISGMTQPAKVIGFLDFAGSWDPSLMMVMVGAIGVHFVARRAIVRRRAPLFDERFHLPERSEIDARLVAGSALFGVGWGVAGYCPGPAIVALASGGIAPLVFVAAMLAGMMVHRLVPSAPRAATV